MRSLFETSQSESTPAEIAASATDFVRCKAVWIADTTKSSCNRERYDGMSVSSVVGYVENASSSNAPDCRVSARFPVGIPCSDRKRRARASLSAVPGAGTDSAASLEKWAAEIRRRDSLSICGSARRGVGAVGKDCRICFLPIAKRTRLLQDIGEVDFHRERASCLPARRSERMQLQRLSSSCNLPSGKAVSRRWRPRHKLTGGKVKKTKKAGYL